MYPTKKNAFWLVLPASLLAFGFLHAQAKFAYVDSQKILTTYTAAMDAQKKLDAENNKWGQEMAKMNSDLENLRQQLENQSLLLSEAKKKERQQEIENARQNIQKFQDTKWGEQGEYFRLQEEILRPVYSRINQVIRKIAEDEGYDFVLDNIEGNILYANDKFDITDVVLEELQKTTGTETTTQTGEPRR